MHIKDKYNQEVSIGDWICCVPQGGRTVEIGKICEFSKSGIPLYKTTSKGSRKVIGKTVEYKTVPIGKGKHGSVYKEVRVPHFTKIIPTKEIDEYYETH